MNGRRSESQPALGRITIGCRTVVWALMFVGVLGWPSGCRRHDGAGESSGKSSSIVLLVASSAGPAMEQVMEEFQRETGLKIAINPGASNALAAQVLQGSPADLFLSASVEWADATEEAGYVAESAPLLSNRLVLIVPPGNPAGVRSPADLLNPQVKRVALATENAPAGRYAMQALSDQGIYPALLEKGVIVRGGDARMTFGLVVRGEVDAGVVYSTDAISEPTVEPVANLDAALTEPIVYPLMLLKHGQRSEAVRRCYEFLRSARAAAIFEQHGFKIISELP